MNEPPFLFQKRESKRKAGALALKGTDFDRSAMKQGDMFDNRKPQPGAACLAGPGFVHNIETFENPFQFIVGDSDTCILDSKPGAGVLFGKRNFNGTVICIFQGIFQKIDHHLFEPEGIAFYQKGFLR